MRKVFGAILVLLSILCLLMPAAGVSEKIVDDCWDLYDQFGANGYVCAILSCAAVAMELTEAVREHEANEAERDALILAELQAIHENSRMSVNFVYGLSNKGK